MRSTARDVAMEALVNPVDLDTAADEAVRKFLADGSEVGTGFCLQSSGSEAHLLAGNMSLRG